MTTVTSFHHDVIIVGAGYAGLTAARELHRAGKSVLILEARDRVGTRVWTRQFDDGSYAAIWVVHGSGQRRIVSTRW